jgi:hypothetical protein
MPQDDRYIAARFSMGTAASAQLDSTPSTQEYEMSNTQQQRDFKVAPFARETHSAQEEKSAVRDAHGQCLHPRHDDTNAVPGQTCWFHMVSERNHP